MGKKSKMVAIYPRSNINLYYFRYNRGIFVFFCVYHGVFRYARHCGVVGKYFKYCIVGKKPRWPPFVQGQTINWYHFWHNRRRFVFFVSIMGFSGMPDIVVLSEKILDITLWVKNPRWPPFVQGKKMSGHHFSQNRYRFVILVSTTVF